MTGRCEICELPLAGTFAIGQQSEAQSCPRCGPWFHLVTSTGAADRPLADAFVTGDPQIERLRRSVASHKIRRMQRVGKIVAVAYEQLLAWKLDEALPTLAAQRDSLILWIGDNQPSPAENAITSSLALEAWLGGAIVPNNPVASLSWLLTAWPAGRFYSRADVSNGQLGFRLSLDGWNLYEELKRNGSQSRLAFMAMKFGFADIDSVVENCFKPAIDETGFVLRKLPDQQPAGSIDDQLRVALHTCRFVVADLTHSSPNAYWEAGFAEGLRRPVIYTCRAKEWETEKRQFDTNHMVTVIWSPGDLEKAARELKAVVRATLPEEAQLEDPGANS